MGKALAPNSIKRVLRQLVNGVQVSQLEAVEIDISVILGRSILPMQQLLRMGRGAVIPLEVGENDEVWILANNHPIARGEIIIQDEKVSISITDAAHVYDFDAAAA
ncbi:MAG: hypothetical protein COA85_09690 [Robiginitomaculum sp.]|nr:MAG: hypothetical protein COA85_09690 [Robiginitomaculum sp.]